MNLKYEELNMDDLIDQYNVFLKELDCSNSFEKQLQLIEDINKIRDDYFSMYWLSYINYLLDVNSKYFNEQEKLFSKYDPIMNNLKLRYYSILNKSPFKEKLKTVIGTKVFKIAELEVKMMNDSILDDLAKEKELSNEYSKILASAKVIFNGEEMPLTRLGKYLLSSDRNIRIEAHKVKNEYMKSIQEKIDDIFSSLVNVRTNIAEKLGFDSYTDVSYLKMRRIDYNKEDISKFRTSVLKHVVPVVKDLKEKQRQNLNINKLMYYDNGILFDDGNAIPKGDTRWIVNQAKKMYQKISPEIYETFNMMDENGLMDLDSRQGKSGGGITTFIPKYNVPIFVSNFNGTSHDIQVLTHEFGHSLQLYLSRNLKYYENWWPTFDFCEIHSTSMELLTLPYMDMFVDDASKYRYEELSSILENMCYICLVDEFQHEIYDNYKLNKDDRKKMWRSLEKKYMPWLNYEDCDYLESGNLWHKQSHIFVNPFYYIDYALAYSVSLQFFIKSIENPDKTWLKYIDFCKQGGTYSFSEALIKNDLMSPFDEKTIEYLISNIKKFL